MKTNTPLTRHLARAFIMLLLIFCTLLLKNNIEGKGNERKLQLFIIKEYEIIFYKLNNIVIFLKSY